MHGSQYPTPTHQPPPPPQNTSDKPPPVPPPQESSRTDSSHPGCGRRVTPAGTTSAASSSRGCRRRAGCGSRQASNHCPAQSSPSHSDPPVRDDHIVNQESASDHLLVNDHVCPICASSMVGSAYFCHACGAPAGAHGPGDRYEWSMYDPAGVAISRPAPIGLASILGSNKSSPFVVPRRITSTSLLGSAHVDLTHSTFIHPTTTVVATQILGTFRLRVPRGVNVEVNGLSILGSFKNGPEAAGTPDASRPTIKVVGASILGGAKVMVDTSCPPLRVVVRPKPNPHPRPHPHPNHLYPDTSGSDISFTTMPGPVTSMPPPPPY